MHASLNIRSAIRWSATSDEAALSPALLRALLLMGCAAAATIATLYGSPETYIRADRELAFLLRGMAVIKGLLVIAAVGVLWWRFEFPMGRVTAVAYLLSAVVTAWACASIWQLTLIVPAALAFHVGGFLLLLVAYLDRTGQMQVVRDGQLHLTDRAARREP